MFKSDHIDVKTSKKYIKKILDPNDPFLGVILGLLGPKIDPKRHFVISLLLIELETQTQAHFDVFRAQRINFCGLEECGSDRNYVFRLVRPYFRSLGAR